MMPHRRFHRAGVVALLAAALVAAAQAQAPESHTRVVMLGTGNPAPDPERFGPATAIPVDSTAYLVDAGVGVMRRWNAARARQLVDGASWKRVVFVTHLHSDHTLGLPELIFTLWMQRPREEINLYGPSGLRAMTTQILEAWTQDVRIRTTAPGDMAGQPAPHVTVHEIAPGEVYRDSLVTVTAFLVHHGSWRQAFGYRFNTPDKVVVLSGDAGPPSAIPGQCRKCDILIHEGGLPAAAATPYYMDFHTTAEELGSIANQSRPVLLVLTHQRAGINERGLAIIRSQYDGKVVIASDLDVYPQ